MKKYICRICKTEYKDLEMKPTRFCMDRYRYYCPKCFFQVVFAENKKWLDLAELKIIK